MRQIAKAAGTVMFAMLLSTLIGLVRQIVVAENYGTGLEIEAFAAANRVSETLFALVAGGALGSAFIPVFTSLLTRHQRHQAWIVASAVANLIFLVLIIASILAFIFAPVIVRYFLAPGFASNPYKESLTISLLRMMLPAAVLFGLSGLVMGILNSHQIFFIPALTPAMYSIGIIFGVLVLSPPLGIYGLAWGVLIGAGLHLVSQLPSLFRLQGQYSPILGLKIAEVREVGRLMLPRLLGVAVVQLNFWLNVWIASKLVEGSVNGLTYAFTLMLMPQAVIAQSIAIAAMPTFSAQVAVGRLAEMRMSLAASLRGVLLLSIPASIGLILLRIPIVSLLYQRGEFTNYSTQLVAWALLWYGVGLVGHSLVEILSRAFYALHDTKTPVFIGISAMSLNLFFSLAFSAWFAKIGWMPHGGLALANSLATALEAIALVVLIRRRLGGFEGRSIIRGVIPTLLGTIFMSAILFFWIDQTGQQPSWFVVGGGIILGAIIYGLIIIGLGVPETKHILRLIKQYIKV